MFSYSSAHIPLLNKFFSSPTACIFRSFFRLVHREHNSIKEALNHLSLCIKSKWRVENKKENEIIRIKRKLKIIYRLRVFLLLSSRRSADRKWNTLSHEWFKIVYFRDSFTFFLFSKAKRCWWIKKRRKTKKIAFARDVRSDCKTAVLLLLNCKVRNETYFCPSLLYFSYNEKEFTVFSRDAARQFSEIREKKTLSYKLWRENCKTVPFIMNIHGRLMWCCYIYLFKGSFVSTVYFLYHYWLAWLADIGITRVHCHYDFF